MTYFWKSLVIEMPDNFHGQLLDLVLTDGDHQWLPFITEEDGKIGITIGKMIQ